MCPSPAVPHGMGASSPDRWSGSIFQQYILIRNIPAICSSSVMLCFFGAFAIFQRFYFHPLTSSSRPTLAGCCSCARRVLWMGVRAGVWLRIFIFCSPFFCVWIFLLPYRTNFHCGVRKNGSPSRAHVWHSSSSSSSSCVRRLPSTVIRHAGRSSRYKWLKNWAVAERGMLFRNRLIVDMIGKALVWKFRLKKWLVEMIGSFYRKQSTHIDQWWFNYFESRKNPMELHTSELNDVLTGSEPKPRLYGHFRSTSWRLKNR